MKAIWAAVAFNVMLLAGPQAHAQAQQAPQPYGKDTVVRRYTITPKEGDKQFFGLGSFCLTVLYNNNFYYLYSENYVEGNTTEGDCDSKGPRTNIGIALNWRYRGEGLQSKACDNNTSQCDWSERNYGVGKSIECVSGSAGRNGAKAWVSTDPVACP